MREVVRKFVRDDDKVFFVSNGIVLQESIPSIMSECNDWMDSLTKTDYNVGWSTPDTMLLIDENDHIYRISYDRYKTVLSSKCTSIIGAVRDGCTVIRYDEDTFTYDYLEADNTYKDKLPIQFGRSSMLRLNDLCDNWSEGTRAITINRNAVYDVKSGILKVVHADYYEEKYGSDWVEYINDLVGNVGYIGDRAGALMISADKVDYVESKKILELMHATDTVINKTVICGNAYSVLTYDCSRFTDDWLYAE